MQVAKCYALDRCLAVTLQEGRRMIDVCLCRSMLEYRINLRSCRILAVLIPGCHW